MSIKNTCRIIFSLLMVELILIVLALGFLSQNNRRIAESEQERSNAMRLSERIRNTAQELDYTVRRFLETGDEAFLIQHRRLITLREGTASESLITREPLAESKTFEERIAQLTPSTADPELLSEANVALGALIDRHRLAIRQLDVNEAEAKGTLNAEQTDQLRTGILDRLERFDRLVDGGTTLTVESLYERGDRYAQLATLLVIMTSLTAVLSGLFLTRRVIDPIRELLGRTEQVRTGRLFEPMPVTTHDEFGELKRQFNEMVEVLDTELKRRQEMTHQLHRSEERFLYVMEATSDGVWDWDIESKHIYRSPSYFGMLGYTQADFPPTVETFFKLLHPDDVDRIRRETDAYVTSTTQDTQRSVIRMMTRTGEVRWVLSRGRVMKRDDEGVPLRITGTHVDITDQRASEAKLRASERKFRRLVEGLNEEYFFFTLNRDGVFTYVSPSIQHVLGYSPEESLRHFRSFLTDNPINEMIGHQLRGGLSNLDGSEFKRDPYEAEVHHKHGGTRLLECVNYALFDPQGNLTGVEGLARDLSRQQQLIEEQETARREAIAANRAKTEFLSHMSHELRTPLNGVMGHVQLLERGDNLTDQQRRDLRLIRDSGQHLLNVISDVLDVSRIESGKLDLFADTVQPRVLFEQALALLQPKAADRGLTMTLHIDDAMPATLTTDPVRVKQVVLNLLGNALKFTEAGGVEVHVQPAMPQRGTGTAAETPTAWSFDVIDTGIGMSPEEQKTIFEPFQQGRDGRKVGGSGLGLSISKRIVEAMAGTIDVESTEGHGTRFTVTLPMEFASADEPEAGSMATSRPERLAKGEVLEVLVVDDQANNRHILEQLLQLSGITPFAVASGEAAIDFLRTRMVPVVLMDLSMPGMDGFEATETIRDLFGPAPPPDALEMESPVVLAVSAGIVPQTRERFFEAGGQGVLPKPIIAGDLFRMISEHCGVRFVSDDEDDPRGVPEVSLGSELEQLSTDDRTRLGRRIQAAIEIGDITDLRVLASELKETHPDHTQLIAALTGAVETFDFASLSELAHQAVESTPPAE